MDRRLDWMPAFDERSRNYGIRGLFGSVPVDREAKFWQEGTVLDQGSEGACVGFGWLAEIIAEPMMPDEQPTADFGNKIAQHFYKEAQQIDQWPGDEYSGTSVLAGAKIMKRYGYIDEYRWCFDIDDIIDAVVAQGPVVIGIPWYDGMYRTNDLGLTSPTGSKVGGHCITLTGYHPAKVFGRQTLEVFKWRNSWGTGYGIDGSGYITVSDLRKLFAEGGEACIPVIRNKPELAYPPRSAYRVNWFARIIKMIVNWFAYRFVNPKALRNK